MCSRAALSAEILFLRKQLAFDQEWQTAPRRLNDSARLSLVFWSRLFDWKSALVIVKPETLVGWHRRGFKLFWKWKSRVGRLLAYKSLSSAARRMNWVKNSSLRTCTKFIFTTGWKLKGEGPLDRTIRVDGAFAYHNNPSHIDSRK